MPAENKRGEIVMLEKLKQKMVKETTRRKKTVLGIFWIIFLIIGFVFPLLTIFDYSFSRTCQACVRFFFYFPTFVFSSGSYLEQHFKHGITIRNRTMEFPDSQIIYINPLDFFEPGANTEKIILPHPLLLSYPHAFIPSSTAAGAY